MNVKCLLHGVALVLLCLPLSGQLLPHSLQLADQPFSYNFAAAPATDAAELQMLFQSQTIGGRLDLSNNAAFRYHCAPFGRKQNWTVGGTILRDRVSSLRQNLFRLNIAARVLERGPFSLNLGVFGGIILARTDHNRDAIAQAGDPVLENMLNLNELDAGLAAYGEWKTNAAEVNGGASVVQLPGNFATRRYHGFDRNGHYYGHLAVLFPFGTQIKMGPAWSGHFTRNRYPVGDFPDQSFFNAPSHSFGEYAWRVQCVRYQCGGYLGYRSGAEAFKLGFNIALLSKRENRQGLSLAVHGAFPRGMQTAGLGAQLETGLLWTWQ